MNSKNLKYFVKGAISAVTLLPDVNDAKLTLTFEYDDKQALENDWRAVGEDIAYAMDLEREAHAGR